MGKARSLWHRLRGSRNSGGQPEVACNETDDSGDSADQTSAITTLTTGSAQAAEQNERDTAKDLRLNAYKKLEEGEGTKKMVQAYEALLSGQVNGQAVQIDESATDSFGGCTPEDKISGMQRVTEVTLEKASRHNERKQGFVKAAKVLNTISSTVIKPMLQTEAVASLAWAGVCVALEFSIRVTTASLDMVDALSHVAKRMEWYMLLHPSILQQRIQQNTLEHDSQHLELRRCLRKAIEDLYYSLLALEIECVCYCYRDSHIAKTLRALVTLDDWKEDADEKFEDIDRTLRHLLAAQEQTFSKQEVRYLQGLVGKFSISDYNKHMKLNPTRVSGTCEWFCNHETFKEWLETNGGLLLVSADPGCGKSTLARYLVEEILPPQNSGGKLAYFFFKDTNEQKTLNTAICAVLHQLLLDDNALVSKLESGITQAGEKITENISALWKLFSAICRDHSGGIICVFDALDECNPNDCLELIRYIKDMLKHGPEIRFLITTWGYPHILKQFMEYESGLIHLDGDGKREKDAIQQEISLVLDYKLAHLSKMKRFDQQLERKDAIAKALRLKGSEQRTYLWLKLVFELMERIPWKSDNDWKKLIMSPPRNVSDAYAKLLCSVPEEDESFVKILLHLMVAAYRPLTLREVCIAINVRESPGAPDDKSLGSQSQREFKDWILQTCGFFVTVYDNRLFFIHQTAKEFLMSSGPGKSWPQGLNWLSPVTEQPAHKIMAESSISYLSLRCFSSKQFRTRARTYHMHPAERQVCMCDPAPDQIYDLSKTCPSHHLWPELCKEYEFLDYTINFWATHFKLCQSYDGANFEDVDDAFMSHYMALFAKDDCCPGWILLLLGYCSDRVTDTGVDLITSYSVCDAALWFDHGRLLAYSLGCNTYAKKFPLHTAAGLNAVNCIGFLAAKGIDVNAQDESGANALSYAASHGAIEAANMLLDHGTDVNLGAAPDELPLSYILGHHRDDSVTGYMELVRRVVCQGADLNNTRVRWPGMIAGMTPLACVSARQSERFYTSAHDENIRRLDDCLYAKASARGPDIVVAVLGLLDLFALDAFVDAYDQSLVKLFLDHGADVDGTVREPLLEIDGRPAPKRALDHACFCASAAASDHVFWNAVFLLHGGANSRIEIETGNSAFDWVLKARVTQWSEERRKPDAHDLNGENRWNALASLVLAHNSASGYINDPISVKTMQTRLHSLTQGEFGPYHLGKVNALLAHGAEVNCRDLEGKTPLHYLASQVCELTEVLAVLDLLIESGAELEVQDSLGRTPLHCVRSSTVLEALVKHGVDIEACDHQGNTPLQAVLASYEARFKPGIMRSLVGIGANLTTSNCLGETLLHTAANFDFADAKSLQQLFGTGENLDVTDGKGESPLQVALSHQSHRAAAFLLERGAGATPLLQRTFDTEQRDRDTGATLLALVSAHHTHDVVRTLLRRGADPNALPWVGAADAKRYLDRVDCMHFGKWAVKAEKNTRAWKLAGSKLPSRFFNKVFQDERPLQLAMHNRWSRDAEITCDLLLMHGADINAESSREQTPLQVACRRGNKEGVQFLLEKGAKIDCTACGGDSAFYSACTAWQPNAELVRALLTYSTMSGLEYHDGPSLYEIVGKWGYEGAANNTSGSKNSDEDDDSSSCRGPAGDPAAIDDDKNDLADLIICRCRKCCRDHESRACAVGQVLLDAGAWTQMHNYQRSYLYSPAETARKRGWAGLATVLEQAAVPNWRRAWLPPNTRRRSFSAA